jgi:hypothetical protein
VDNTVAAKVIDRGKKLAALQKTDGWAELRLMVAARKEKFSRNLADRLLVQGVAVDQREVDYRAGFFAGCEWLLGSVDHAEESLEKALVRAQELKGSDAA